MIAEKLCKYAALLHCTRADLFLGDITHGKAKKMFYTGFGEKITRQYRIVLVEWPLPELTRPSKIRSITDLEVLHNAWQNNTARFRKLTGAEYDTWKRENPTSATAQADQDDDDDNDNNTEERGDNVVGEPSRAVQPAAHTVSTITGADGRSSVAQKESAPRKRRSDYQGTHQSKKRRTEADSNAVGPSSAVQHAVSPATRSPAFSAPQPPSRPPSVFAPPPRPSSVFVPPPRPSSVFAPPPRPSSVLDPPPRPASVFAPPMSPLGRPPSVAMTSQMQLPPSRPSSALPSHVPPPSQPPSWAVLPHMTPQSRPPSATPFPYMGSPSRPLSGAAIARLPRPPSAFPRMPCPPSVAPGRPASVASGSHAAALFRPPSASGSSHTAPPSRPSSVAGPSYGMHPSSALPFAVPTPHEFSATMHHGREVFASVPNGMYPMQFNGDFRNPYPMTSTFPANAQLTGFMLGNAQTPPQMDFAPQIDFAPQMDFSAAPWGVQDPLFDDYVPSGMGSFPAFSGGVDQNTFPLMAPPNDVPTTPSSPPLLTTSWVVKPRPRRAADTPGASE